MRAVELVVRHDVVREHGRSERAADARDLLPDLSAPQNADNRGGKLTSSRLPPDAFANLTRERHQLSRERNHHQNRELGDGLPVHARSPSNRDAMPPRRVEIDRVEPDAVLAHHAHLGHRAEDRRVERLESGDGFLVAAEEVDQLAARQDAIGEIEPRAGIPLQELGAQRRVARKRARGHGNRHVAAMIRAASRRIRIRPPRFALKAGTSLG